VIEHYLREITDQLSEISTITGRLDEINANVTTVIRHVSGDHKRRGG
jgi:hypothetical protein